MTARLYAGLGIAVLLAAMPAAGQIVQRMERDVLAATKPVQQLEKAPLVDLERLKKIALFTRFGRDLRSEETGILRRVGLRLSQGDYAAAQKDWELALGKMKDREFVPDVDVLVQGVLHYGYLDKEMHLYPLAAAVRFREEQREAAYQERTRLENWKATYEAGEVKGELQMRRLILPEEFATDVRAVQWTEPSVASTESVTEDLQKVVVLCAAADDNLQQAVLDLQKAMEGEPLQTLSSAAKMLYDTAKPIIGNLKG